MAENETVTETVASESSEPEFVAIEDASDTEIDAELERLLSEAPTEEAPHLESDDELEEDSEEESEPESEEPSDETEAVKKPELNGDKDAEIAKLKAKNEEIQTKRLEERKQRETYIQRLKHQLGEARKLSTDKVSNLEARYKELRDLDPAEAVDVKLELLKEKETLAGIDNQEATMEAIHENQSIFEQHIGPDVANIDDIAAAFERDKMPPEFVESVRKNPFATVRAETLVQTAKRIHAEKGAVILYGMVKAKDAEIAELKKQLGNKQPTSVDRSLKKIAQAAKRIPSMTGARGGGSSTRDLGSLDVTKMSDKELDEQLKQLTGR